jgi:aminoglycoside 3-N-acetyltransferase
MPLPLAAVVRKADLVQGLAALGIGAGDTLLLHSALSSLGQVEGGAPTVVEAFLAVLGPAGTLVVPTLPDVSKPFAAESSPSAVGQLTEAVRQWRGAVRSRHPTHAVAAIGAQARHLTDGHELTLPCGHDSPYGKLGGLRGWVLLLGVDQDRNTTWHVAETIADVAYLQTMTVQIAQADGSVREATLPKSPWGHRAFIGLDRRLRETGLVRVGRVGSAVARLMRADEMIAWGVERLREDPAAFLCAKPRCVFCQWARAVIRGEAARIDWAERSRHDGCGDVHCEVCSV